MSDERTRLFLPFSLLMAILAISTASIFIRFAQADGAPSLLIAALRLTIATFLLTPVTLIRNREELRNLIHSELALGILSGVFLAIHFGTWISSLEFTSVASSVVFVSTGPLWVALLSPLLLNERLSRAAIIGLALALLGGTVIGLTDACILQDGLSCPGLTDVIRGRSMWGNFMALVGAWAIAGYLIIGRKLRTKLSLLSYIFLVYSIAAMTLIVFIFALGISPFGYAPRAYGWIFLLAAIPQLIGHSTFNWALRYIPATFVAVITLGEPVGSAILALIILKEIPSIATVIGGTFILAGIFLASRQNK